MRHAKLIKLGLVGLALLLIPRRSSKHASGQPNPNNQTKQKDKPEQNDEPFNPKSF